MTTFPSWLTSGWCGASHPSVSLPVQPGHGGVPPPPAAVVVLDPLDFLLLLPHAATINANTATAMTATRIFPLVISSPCSCLPPCAANTLVALARAPCELSGYAPH